MIQQVGKRPSTFLRKSCRSLLRHRSRGRVEENGGRSGHGEGRKEADFPLTSKAGKSAVLRENPQLSENKAIIKLFMPGLVFESEARSERVRMSSRTLV